MADKQALINEINTLPTDYIEEIFHYVLFLKQLKSNTINDISLASEHSLAKDWLLPEEDTAWGSL